MSGVDQIEAVLEGHPLQYGPKVGQICGCGHVVRSTDRGPDDLRTQQEIHHRHVAEEIAGLLAPVEQLLEATRLDLVETSGEVRRLRAERDGRL